MRVHYANQANEDVLTEEVLNGIKSGTYAYMPVEDVSANMTSVKWFARW